MVSPETPDGKDNVKDEPVDVGGGVDTTPGGAPVMPPIPMGGGGQGMGGPPPGMPAYPGYPPPHHAPPQAPGGFPGFPPMSFPGGGGYPPMMPPGMPYYAPPHMGPMGMATGTVKKGAEGEQLCTVHPPGMPRPFDVPFPARKLPVCVRCKKNFRSRELCRVRDGHRALPWQVTYVVVTLTDAVLEKAEDGTLSYADIPVVAELQETPLMCRGPGDGFMADEPICKVCKEKNYTRDYCRNTSRHSTPPYQAVYVKLVPKTDENDLDARPQKRKKRKAEEGADGQVRPDPDAPPEEDGEKGGNDDLNQIHASKTFFLAMSAKKMVVKWCEQIQYPPESESSSSSAGAQASQGGPPGMNMPFMSGAPNMQGVQGQMWDAFRAGAMWAQSQAGQIPPGYGYPPPYGGAPQQPPPPPEGKPNVKGAI